VLDWVLYVAQFVYRRFRAGGLSFLAYLVPVLSVLSAIPGFAQVVPSPLNGTAKVLTLTGQVSLLRDNAPWALNPGDLVQPLQIVITGPDGYAIFQIADGSKFEVFPNSRVIFRNNRGDWKDLLEVLIGKVKVVGFDNAPDEVTALSGGQVSSLIVQNPYKIGYEGVAEVVDLLEHKKVPLVPVARRGGARSSKVESYARWRTTIRRAGTPSGCLSGAGRSSRVRLAAGGAVLVRDLLVWLDTGRWLPLALGEAWHDLSRASCERAPAVLGEPIAGALFAVWLGAASIVPGLALLFLCRRRRGVSRRPS